jgi:hypothetical protein
MHNFQIFPYPGYQVIFKGALDNLVEQVGGQQFVNVGTWKTMGKRLRMGQSEIKRVAVVEGLTRTSGITP